jgi:hypothetical protein
LLSSISDNLDELTSSYPYQNGYFGEKGKGRHFTRNIYSADPVKASREFYDKAAYGGVIQSMANGKGETAKMNDGTIISYREVTSSEGSPAVEINISKSTDSGGVKRQKIHFAKE